MAEGVLRDLERMERMERMEGTPDVVTLTVGGNNLLMGDRPERILPRMDEWEIYPRIAAAVGMAAQESGTARLIRSYDELRAAAGETIQKARDLATELFAGETVASGAG